MSSEIDKVFSSLQDRMVEQATIYKDTKFNPFYLFCIGEMEWTECVEKITKEFE